MVSDLTALSLWTGEAAYADRAEAILKAFAASIAGNPVGHSGLLSAALDARAEELKRLAAAAGEGPLRR